MRTASRLREMIDQEEIHHASSPVSASVTISQGVITVRPSGEHQPSDLIEMVDRALYSAKGAGRDAIAVE